MYDRDFLPDSDDSFSQSSGDDEPNRFSAPEQPAFSAYNRGFDFQIEDPQGPQFSNMQDFHSDVSYNEPKRQTTPPGHSVAFHTAQPQPVKANPDFQFKPLHHQTNDKVGFAPYEDPRPETTESRPVTGARPPSANAAMRANMLKKQREALLGRNVGTTEIKTNDNFIGLGVAASVTGRLGNSDLDRLIGSNGMPDIMKSSQTFTSYEPGVKRDQPGPGPAPIKPGRMHIGLEQEPLDNQELDESSAVRRPPSRALQELHRQAEIERQRPTPPPVQKKPVEESYSRTHEAYAVSKEPISGFAPQQAEVYIPSHRAGPAQYSEPPRPKEQAPPVEVYRQEPPKMQYQSPPAPAEHYQRPTSQPGPMHPPTAYGPPQPPYNSSNPLGPPVPPTSQAPSILISGQLLAQQETPLGPPPDIRNPEGAVHQTAVPRPPSINIQQVLQQEMTDMRRFLTRPVPQGIMLQCNIRRDKSGFKRLAPRYYMHLCEGHTFLISGKKRLNNKTSNYLISSSQTDLNVKSSSYLGKVRSNFMGTEFNVFDTGLNPKKKKASRANIREQLGVFLYVSAIQESNLLGSKGPRKMRVMLPAVNASGERFSWRPVGVSASQKDDTMLARFNAGDSTGIFSYYNKPPKWNECKS